MDGTQGASIRGCGPEQRSARRATALGVALSLAAGCVAVAAGAHVNRLLDSTAAGALTPEHGLEVLCAGGAGLAAAWLALILLGAAACARGRRDPVRRAAEALAPVLTARIAASLIGSVALVGGTAAAHATPPPSSPIGVTQPLHAPPPTLATPAMPGAQGSGDLAPAVTVPPEAADDIPDPGWRPTSPPGRHTVDDAAISLVSRGSARPDSVVVRSGDTLWAIAARHLGEEADAGAIAAEWPRWYEANRESIGADPDLLLPGTVLIPPEASPEAVAS